MNISTVSLWNKSDLCALVTWGKTFHHPWRPDVEWNIWQLALAAEALLAEQVAAPPVLLHPQPQRRPLHD